LRAGRAAAKEVSSRKAKMMAIALDSTVNTGPLKDLRVVEMGQLIAGPFCGQLLGDMGADIIKVEPPGAGDPMRQWGRGEPVWWEVIGRNKRSVSVNLRVAEGQALARKLIATADVLIENFRPGAMEGWNLAPADLLKAHPGLIVVRMSGYGQTGPYANRTGFGGIGEAMGGWRNIVGDPDRPPSRMGVSIGDSLAATYGCMGVLAALHHRERTGEGQIIDSALYESVLQVMESLVAEYAVAGVVRERSGSILPGIAPSNVYRCRDGDYMIGANQDSLFGRLAEVMGQPELARDPRYVNHAARGANQAELDVLIEAWTLTRTVDEVEALMLAASIPAGRIYKAPDLVADPHIAAREAIIDVPHPRWPGLKMQGVFPKMSVTPGSVRSIAPQVVGQHNDEVFRGLLGLGDDEMLALATAGAI
jgi:crotonobetainyl-CoA:carnitine CoA-transferase CaiB-like acyl-CoA transferase